MITKRAAAEVQENIEVAEYDKAGSLKRSYIQSRHGKGASRVDIILPPNRKGILRRLLDVFLPDGYPNSVTDDYTPYQIWDSLQAVAGSMASMISSSAVWESYGVGDAKASPVGAMIVTVIRESMGRLATITFAHTMGTSIEAECKMYRLASDIFCDTAVIIDAFSPLIPISYRFAALCLSSVLFAAAGVAGNSSKSSLSAHFAKRNNLGELIAKDGSQETAISLIGMVMGSLVISSLTTPLIRWITLLSLIAAHLWMNRTAVRAVRLRSLNRQRANLLFSNLIENDEVLSPEKISEREVIFEKYGGGVLRWMSGEALGRCEFGVPLQRLLRSLPKSRHHGASQSLQLGSVDLSTLLYLFRGQQYVMWCDTSTSRWYNNVLGSNNRILIVLKEGSTPKSQIKAWYHALLLAHQLRTLKDERPTIMLDRIASSLDSVDHSFDNYSRRLRSAGWDFEIPVLETKSGSRITAISGSEMCVDDNSDDESSSVSWTTDDEAKADDIARDDGIEGMFAEQRENGKV